MNWLVATVMFVTAVFGSNVSPGPTAWVYPIGAPNGPAEVVRGFDPPDSPWLAGHRGVDLAGTIGAEVRAAAAGRVTYAGLVAGRGVVVVDHGSLRSTYEPVQPTVSVGDVLDAGHPIGTLTSAESHCPPRACLHWGVLSGQRYVDPLRFVTFDAIRLLPLGERTLSGSAPTQPTSTSLSWPVAEPRITSPYGMRVHPITGVHKLHDGTDFGAACGTPVRAATSGRVTQVGPRGAYGLQVTIEHGNVGTTRITTSYSHLSRTTVSAQQPVQHGQVIGRVGNTGSSTGCHLHFMLYTGGGLADPMRWLPSATSPRPPAQS